MAETELPPFMRQPNNGPDTLPDTPEDVQRRIDSEEDIELSLIAAMNNLSVLHASKSKAEEDVRVAKPTTEEGWAELANKRWADASFIRVNDFSLAHHIPALAGKRLTYEELFNVLEDLEERTIIHGCEVFYVHPDISPRLEKRSNIIDLTKQSYPVGVSNGGTRAAQFIVPLDADDSGAARLYKCRLNVTHFVAARKDLHLKADRKVVKKTPVNEVIHWESTDITVTKACLDGPHGRKVSITRDTVCVPLAHSARQWLVIDLASADSRACVIQFEENRTVHTLHAHALDGEEGRHRFCIIEREAVTGKDRLCVLEAWLEQGPPLEVAKRCAIDIRSESMHWLPLTGTVSAFYFSWMAEGRLAWAITEECAYYTMGLREAMPVRRDDWGTNEEERNEINKRGAIYKSPPRQPIVALYVAPESNNLFASSADNMMFFMNSKPKASITVLRDTGMTVNAGIVGNTLIALRASGEVVYSTIGGSYPGKPLQCYETSAKGAGPMPKDFARNYSAVWCTVGRSAVLLPNGVLAVFVPMNRDQIEGLRQHHLAVKERLEAEKAQQRLAGE